MSRKDELSKIWDKLGNLEEIISELEELNVLLTVLTENYVSKVNIELNNKDDMYTLWRNYPYIQSLLNSFQRCLHTYQLQLKDTTYQIYDYVKVLKTNNEDSTTLYLH